MRQLVKLDLNRLASASTRPEAQGLGGLQKLMRYTHLLGVLIALNRILLTTVHRYLAWTNKQLTASSPSILAFCTARATSAPLEGRETPPVPAC